MANLVITAILSYFLSLIYTRYGTSLSNRKLFAQNFVILSLTTMIIITIIKSSLALSLGLVGALSIIRFRSAIKEPEELTYVFICICIGLGMGASQWIITSLGFAFVAAIIVSRRVSTKAATNHNLHLTVSSDNSNGISLEKIVTALNQNSAAIDLKRVDENDQVLEASFLVEFTDFNQLNSAKSSLRDLGKDVTCLLYTSPSPRDATLSRMPSSA